MTEGQFRSLIENGYDVITVTDEEGIIRYDSPTLIRRLGYSAEERLGQPMLAYVHPDDVGKVCAVFQEALSHPGTSVAVECRILHKDGSWRHVEAVGKNLLHDPTVRGVVGNFHDVTEQRLAEQQLREREARFRALTENTSDVVSAVDADGCITYCSRSVQRMLGYRREELVGRHADELVHPDDVDRVSQTVDELRATPDKRTKLTYRLRHRNGSWRVVECIACNLLNNPAVRSIVRTHRDISDRWATEQALLTSEEQYRAIVETANEGIVRLDARGVVSYVNQRFCEIQGFSEDELVGRPLADFAGEEARSQLDHRFQARAKGQREQFEVRVPRKDGTLVWVNISASPQFDGQGRFVGVVAMLTDITERKHAEQSLRGSEERYRQIVETAQEGIWIVDGDGKTTFVNCRMAEMLGYSVEDMIGKHVLDFVDAGHHASIRTRLERRRRGKREQYDFQFIGQGGRALWAMISATPIHDDGGQYIGSMAMAVDITDRKLAEQALAHQALHDNLTGLPNRALLMDRLHQAILASRRQQTGLALLLLDLDQFKEINDTFGHHYGDVLLQQVGARLSRTVRDSDTVARLGGDEFAILLSAVSGFGQVPALVEKLTEALAPHFEVEEQSLEVEASIGVAFFPDHGENAETLMRRADVAMYAAKRARSGHALYSPEGEHEDSRLVMTGELRRAIETGQLQLFYQPKVEMLSGEVAGVEALLRWQHPEHGLILPDRFIRLAEQTSLIKPLTRWVIDTALQQLEGWRRAGKQITVAINLSMQNLRDPELPGMVIDLLEKWRVPPDQLKFEITESAIMADPEQSMRVVTQLHDLGVAFSIDDFGTGYSSLAYLKALPAHEIKIDKSFVLDVLSDENDAVIVRSIIDLAHNLGRIIVAEGVENRDIWEVLTTLGCDLAQGYYSGCPMPIERFDRWLDSWVPGQIPKLGAEAA